MDTKTDTHKTGQWATFAASLRPNSAYQLYRRLVTALSDELRPEEVSQWPVMFGLERSQLAQSSALLAPKIKYQEFLRILKRRCDAIGLEPSLFGTLMCTAGRGGEG